MNKKIEKMKFDIQNRIKKHMGFISCILGFLCLATTNVLPVNLGNESHNDFVMGFQIGLLTTLLIVFVARLTKYRNALKDEKLLKQLYYKENDERICYINQQVGKSSISITTTIMIIAAIISGYFNITVFFTLLGATLLQSLIQIVLRWYYNNQTSSDNSEE